MQWYAALIGDALRVADEVRLEHVERRIRDPIGAKAFVEDADLLDVLGLGQASGEGDLDAVHDDAGLECPSAYPSTGGPKAANGTQGLTDGHEAAPVTASGVRAHGQHVGAVCPMPSSPPRRWAALSETTCSADHSRIDASIGHPTGRYCAYGEVHGIGRVAGDGTRLADAR